MHQVSVRGGGMQGGRELQLQRGASWPNVRLVQRDSEREWGVLFLEWVELRPMRGGVLGQRYCVRLDGDFRSTHLVQSHTMDLEAFVASNCEGHVT